MTLWLLEIGAFAGFPFSLYWIAKRWPGRFIPIVCLLGLLFTVCALFGIIPPPSPADACP